MLASQAVAGAAYWLQPPVSVRSLLGVLAFLTLAVANGCGGSETSTNPPQTNTTPTAAAKPAIWPLRGTTAPNADAVRRRPLVVKIANDSAARPQSGIAQADVVMEIVVEGGITRYALIFQSQDPDRVGPVRSARQSDLNYLPMLKAVVAHVGASQEVTRLVRDAAKSGAFIDIDEFEHADAFERITQRPAPYNAYTSGKKVRDAAGTAGAEKVNVPALAFGAAGIGTEARSLVVPYEGAQRVEYEYDAASTCTSACRADKPRSTRAPRRKCGGRTSSSSRPISRRSRGPPTRPARRRSTIARRDPDRSSCCATANASTGPGAGKATTCTSSRTPPGRR